MYIYLRSNYVPVVWGYMHMYVGTPMYVHVRSCNVEYMDMDTYLHDFIYQGVRQIRRVCGEASSRLPDLRLFPSGYCVKKRKWKLKEDVLCTNRTARTIQMRTFCGGWFVGLSLYPVERMEWKEKGRSIDDVANTYTP